MLLTTMLPLGVMVKWPSSVSLIPPMKTLVVKLVVKLFLLVSTPNHGVADAYVFGVAGYGAPT